MKNSKGILPVLELPTCTADGRARCSTAAGCRKGDQLERKALGLAENWETI